MYSQLRSIEEDNAQPMVNRFLNLHDDMIQAKAITQSLANIRTLRTSESDSLTTGSIKEAVQVTSERKKHAASWIKAAVASDLSPFPAPTKPAVNSTKAAKTKRKICSVNCSKPRGSCIINKQQKNAETQLIQAASEESLEWVKGSSLLVVADLANALQGECKRWFLNYVEKYLDDLGSKTSTNESESEIAGVLCQIKRVEDWLGVVTHNQDNQFKDACALSEDEETQACGRVRKKIYSILLKHVESAARALENMSVAASDDL